MLRPGVATHAGIIALLDLFTHALTDHMKTEAPIAARMRPRTLDEYVD